ncbi:MAG: alpha/beta hydrolase [Flaviflexus sp.]|nr:alpha/beta hydrolase [Flaviflexus sp.]
MLTLNIAPGQCRGTVLLTHGYAEHAGRYLALIAALNDAGYDVFFRDLPGHGHSAGPRARVDVAELIHLHFDMRGEVRKRMRGGPFFAFGHSMGGLVTAASALIHPEGLDGVVLSGPALRPLPDLPEALVKIMVPVGRLCPGLPAATLDAEAVSRDPAVREAYDSDPLCYHGPVPLLTGATMMDQARRTLAHAHRWDVDLPLLIFHGTKDALADVTGSRQFAAAVTSSGGHAELREVPEAFHEVFNEPEAPQLRAELVSWLGKH